MRLLNGFRHPVRLGCDAVEVVAWSRYIDGHVGNVRYLSCPSGHQFCSNISCSFPTFSNIKLNYDTALVEWHLLLKAVFSVTLVNLMLVIIGLTAPINWIKSIFERNTVMGIRCSV